MSLLNTRLQNIRSGSNIDKYEYRASRYGAFDLFVNQTDDPAGIITPELTEKAMTSIGRAIEIPVIDFDGGLNIQTGRPAVIVDSENTSQIFDAINWVSLSWGFTVTPALYMNNEISIQRDFETKFMKYLYEVANFLDTQAEAALLAASTGVINDTLQYALVGGMLQCDWASREMLLGDLNPIMAANDYYNQLHVVGNTGIESLVRSLTEKGLYNEINKQMQYSDKILHFTNRIANDPAAYGTGYAVNGGSVGLIKRMEREALLRTTARTGHEWDIERLPLLDMEVGTYYYEGVGSEVGLAGAASADMTRAKKQYYGFAIDIAFLTRYNSRPGVDSEPIIHFEVLS